DHDDMQYCEDGNNCYVKRMLEDCSKKDGTLPTPGICVTPKGVWSADLDGKGCEIEADTIAAEQFGDYYGYDVENWKNKLGGRTFSGEYYIYHCGGDKNKICCVPSSGDAEKLKGILTGDGGDSGSSDNDVNGNVNQNDQETSSPPSNVFVTKMCSERGKDYCCLPLNTAKHITQRDYHTCYSKGGKCLIVSNSRKRTEITQKQGSSNNDWVSCNPTSNGISDCAIGNEITNSNPCKCGGEAYSTGYCCDSGWQPSDCSGGSGSGSQTQGQDVLQVTCDVCSNNEYDFGEISLSSLISKQTIIKVTNTGDVPIKYSVKYDSGCTLDNAFTVTSLSSGESSLNSKETKEEVLYTYTSTTGQPNSGYSYCTITIQQTQYDGNHFDGAEHTFTFTVKYV
ncbi:MAG: hypothetical protein GXO64_01480, partial [Candidatus Micrarchaeota archaeon]|nr:hypothetical protein [Candidatus Micrarchaeota archaeon]